jgi:hypothetical protein
MPKLYFNLLFASFAVGFYFMKRKNRFPQLTSRPLRAGIMGAGLYILCSIPINLSIEKKYQDFIDANRSILENMIRE